MFNIDLSTAKRCRGKIITRIAAKAVIYDGDRLLMIGSVDGDLKFPGGGVKGKESNIQALKREIMEETGYIIQDVIAELGTVTEFKADKYERGAFFEMISHYYLCTLSQDKTETNMDEYEKKLQMEPVWVGLEDAIKQNEEVLAVKANFWVERELIVLKELKKLKAGIK